MDGSIKGLANEYFMMSDEQKYRVEEHCRVIVKMTRARKGISISIELFVVQRFVSPFVPLLANAGDTECGRRQMSLPNNKCN